MWQGADTHIVYEGSMCFLKRDKCVCVSLVKDVFQRSLMRERERESTLKRVYNKSQPHLN